MLRNLTALPTFRVDAVLCRETQILYDHSRQSLDIAALRHLYFYPRNPRAAFSCVKQSCEYQGAGVAAGSAQKVRQTSGIYGATRSWVDRLAVTIY